MASKKIDELQLSYMVAAVGIDEIERLLDKYSHDFNSSAEELRIAGEKGNAVEFGRAIHALKGVSSNFGFSAITFYLDQMTTEASHLDIDLKGLEREVEDSLRKARELVLSFN